MALDVVKIDLQLRWWAMPYLQTLAFLCAIMGAQPDADKVVRFLLRYGFRLTIGGRPRRITDADVQRAMGPRPQ